MATPVLLALFLGPLGLVMLVLACLAIHDGSAKRFAEDVIGAIRGEAELSHRNADHRKRARRARQCRIAQLRGENERLRLENRALKDEIRYLADSRYA